MQLDYGEHESLLRQVDVDGTASTSRAVKVALNLDESHEVGIPYPNPVHGSTTVDGTVSEAQPVLVKMYDVEGRHVRTIYDRILAGLRTRRLQIDTEGLASSTYFVRVDGERFLETRRSPVVK